MGPQNIQDWWIGFSIIVCYAAIPPNLKLVSFMFLYLSRFLSPLSAVPLVALSGFGLYKFGFPVVCIYELPTTTEKECQYHFFPSAPPPPQHPLPPFFTIPLKLYLILLDYDFECLACKMCGDWAATTHHSSIIFTGNFHSSFAVISLC